MVGRCLIEAVLLACAFMMGCQPDVDRFRKVVDQGIAVDVGGQVDAHEMNPRPDASTSGQCTVRFQLSFPSSTPPSDPLHIAGDFYGGERAWDPVDPTLVLQRNSEGAFTELVLSDGSVIEYKYTRGNWETVEVAADCSEKDNRPFTVDCSASPSGRSDTVAAWSDTCSSD